MRVKFILGLALLLISASLSAQNLYWAAGAAGNWSTVTNWSTASSGASPGTGIPAGGPGGGNTAIFDGLNGHTFDCTLTGNVVVGAITMAGYNGTITFGANSL